MLISFFVDDLLRCRCYSQEEEITTLYNELQRINKERPELLKIVNVRSRLEYVTKDIKINLLYRNKIVIEMQLGIKSERSRFIKYSNKFNHFIYELQRSGFGPIIELSNIWMTCDPRADYFAKKIHQMAPTQLIGPVCRRETTEMKNHLPFKCGHCNQYINHIVYRKKHRVCKKSGLKICLNCIIKGLSSFTELKAFFPEFPNPNIDNKLELRGEEIPETGLLLNLISFNSMPQRYRLLEIEGKKQVCILLGYHIERISYEKFNQEYTITDKGEVRRNDNNLFVPWRKREKVVDILEAEYDLY